MADWRLYAVDFDTGDIQYIEPSDIGSLPPSGPAGGDLGGTYPNPTVVTVPDGALSANIPIMSGGILPAVDARYLTNVPLSVKQTYLVGQINSSGYLDISGIAGLALAVSAIWMQSSAGMGQLFWDPGTATINSTNGGLDVGLYLCVMAINP